MQRWRPVVGLAAVVQVAAGVAYFVWSPVPEMAPFGLALCAGIGLLSVASLKWRGLIRVAVAANVLLAVLTALGLVPVLIRLATGTFDPLLVRIAVGNVILAAASAASAVGLKRLSSSSSAAGPRRHRHAPRAPSG